MYFRNRALRALFLSLFLVAILAFGFGCSTNTTDNASLRSSDDDSGIVDDDDSGPPPSDDDDSTDDDSTDDDSTDDDSTDDDSTDDDSTDDDSIDDDSTDDDSTDDDSTDDDSTDDDSTDDDSTDDDSTDDDSTDDDSTDDDSTDDDSTDDDDDDDSTPPSPDAPFFDGLKSAWGGMQDTDYIATLLWETAVDQQGDSIIYNIYESDDPSPSAFNFTTPNYTTDQLSYVVTSLAADTMYCYIVRAEDTDGNEDLNQNAFCIVAAMAYYVDALNGGDPASGTANDPFLNLTQVQTAIGSGATANVYLAEGTFTDTMAILDGLVGVYGGWFNDLSKGVWTRDTSAYLTEIDTDSANLIEAAGGRVFIDAITFTTENNGGFVGSEGIAQITNSTFNNCNAGVTLSGGGDTFTGGLIFSNQFNNCTNGLAVFLSATGQFGGLISSNTFDACETGVSLVYNSNAAIRTNMVVYANTFSENGMAMDLTINSGDIQVQASTNIIQNSTNIGIYSEITNEIGPTILAFSQNEIRGSVNAGIMIVSSETGDTLTANVELNKLWENGNNIEIAATESAKRGGKAAIGAYNIKNNRIIGGENGVWIELTNNGLDNLEFDPLLANNFIVGAINHGIVFETHLSAGSFAPYLAVLNNDIFGCGAAGLYANIPLSDTHGSRLFNNILLSNTPDLEFISGGIGLDEIAYNDYFIGPSPTGPGNIAADPHLANMPMGFDWATGGTTNTLTVENSTIYHVGDKLEISDDGVVRTITAVSGTTINFSPAFSTPIAVGQVLFYWDTNTNVTEDYSLNISSPCLDAGDPDVIYNDVNGSRNDMGATGGPYYISLP